MRSAAVLVLAPLAILTTACSPSAAAPDPYRADVLRAYQHATSAFERSVLVDGKITRAEYDQAIALYVHCVRAHGVPISAQLEAPLKLTYVYAIPGADAPQSVLDNCTRGTTDLIESIYNDEVMNPHKQDLNQLTADCFVRKGLVPKGYTGAQFAADSAGQGRAHYPFNPDDPKIDDKFSACMEAPAN
jgi:hypothetical protein